jgi:hypothetical protein
MAVEQAGLNSIGVTPALNEAVNKVHPVNRRSRNPWVPGLTPEVGHAPARPFISNGGDAGNHKKLRDLAGIAYPGKGHAVKNFAAWS